jgi:hypothetical protein
LLKRLASRGFRAGGGYFGAILCVATGNILLKRLAIRVLGDFGGLGEYFWVFEEMGLGSDFLREFCTVAICWLRREPSKFSAVRGFWGFCLSLAIFCLGGVFWFSGGGNYFGPLFVVRNLLLKSWRLGFGYFGGLGGVFLGFSGIVFGEVFGQ